MNQLLFGRLADDTDGDTRTWLEAQPLVRALRRRAD